MELKCMLVTVEDMERARKFYEDVFGLELLQDNDGNMLLSGGLALQRRISGRSSSDGTFCQRATQVNCTLKTRT